MKERVLDLKDKLKKSENRSYANLGMGRRLNISSRRIIKDDDNDHDTSEQRNGEKTPIEHEDSDPLFPAKRFLPSNLGSLPRRVQSPSNEGVRKCSVLKY